jgi:hypothetical protein
MTQSARNIKSGSRGFRSLLIRALSSYWVERVMFAVGSILLFSAEQILTGHVEKAHEDLSYFDHSISMILNLSSSRKRSFSEYNRSVATRPQVRELVAQNAYDLFTDTDELLTGLRAVVEQDGRGQVLSLLGEKNDRREVAAQELKNGNAEALVARVNEIAPHHEQCVEPLTAKLMLKRRNSALEESRWIGRLKTVRLSGTILLASAFILREVKDYRRKQSDINSGERTKVS